jgi:IclR family acetate operon transcriptional repressor
MEVELRTVEREGFAVDDEEMEIGACCVAAVIRGSGGEPIGSISVSGVAARLPQQSRTRIGAVVVTHCKEISAQLASRSAAADDVAGEQQAQ